MSLDESQITGTWDYSLLPSNVRVGSDCWLERYSSFTRFRSDHNPGLSLGNRVRVYTWTAFNVEPSGLIEIGDDSILVGAVFMCAQRISIGERVTISYRVTLADSDFHPIDPNLRRQDAIAISPQGDKNQRPPYESKPICIEDDVWIGIGAMILKGVTVGAGARIQAGAVVTRDVPAGATVAGNPARVVNGAEQSHG
jgi:acetyltransferase-like isoleucine patch superfamily enzyme